MSATLLLYILVRDLREFGDDDLREILTFIVGDPEAQDSELQTAAEALLESDTLDRDAIQELPIEFLEWLPKTMEDYEEALTSFDGILEAALEEEGIEDNDRVERFRYCLELLIEDDDWQSHSEAARGIGTLEEELYLHRDEYEAQPMTLEECSAQAVVGHLNLREGFETWREAFRLAHEGELEDALETAVEATCLFVAVERWSEFALSEELGEVSLTVGSRDGSPKRAEGS